MNFFPFRKLNILWYLGLWFFCFSACSFAKPPKRTGTKPTQKIVLSSKTPQKPLLQPKKSKNSGQTRANSTEEIKSTPQVITQQTSGKSNGYQKTPTCPEELPIPNISRALDPKAPTPKGNPCQGEEKGIILLNSSKEAKDKAYTLCIAFPSKAAKDPNLLESTPGKLEDPKHPTSSNSSNHSAAHPTQNTLENTEHHPKELKNEIEPQVDKQWDLEQKSENPAKPEQKNEEQAELEQKREEQAKLPEKQEQPDATLNSTTEEIHTLKKLKVAEEKEGTQPSAINELTDIEIPSQQEWEEKVTRLMYTPNLQAKPVPKFVPPFSLQLVKMMYEIAQHFGKNQITIISGLRSPEAAAKRGYSKSLHVQGRACDFYINGVPSVELFDYIRSTYQKDKNLKNQTGIGVIYYPRWSRDFVHLEVREDSYFYNNIELANEKEPSHYCVPPPPPLAH